MLPKKLPRTIKNLKSQIQRTQEECMKVWEGRKNPRGILVTQLIHIVLVVVSTVGTIPYKVVKLEEGYREFRAIQGVRKWVFRGMHTYMVLRAVSYALLPILSQVKLAHGGMLTADCLIWALSVALAAVPTIVGTKLSTKGREPLLIYNSFQKLLRSCSRKYLKGKHVFELATIHWMVLGVLVATSAGTILVPLVAMAIFIPLKDSPAFLSYHISGPYSDIQDGDILRIVGYWIGALVHWLYLNYLGWLMIFVIVLLGEAVVGFTLLLKIIGSHDPKTIRWRDKIRVHAQLEYLVNMFNDWAGMTMPILVLTGLMLSVCSILVLMKMDLEMGFPTLPLIPFFIILGGGCSIGVCVVLSYAETFRANSIGYLAAVEAEITAHMMLEVRRGKEITYCPSGRTFRRRPIGVRIGNFMLMDEAFGISYLMQIVDNVVNYYFMVDLRSHPVWLW